MNNKTDKFAYEYAREHGIIGQDYNQIYDAAKYGVKAGMNIMLTFITEYAKNYAFAHDDGSVDLNTFMHDFMKDVRVFDI